MARDYRWGLFLNEISLFFLVQALGLYVGYKLFLTEQIIALGASSSIITFLTSFTISTIALVLVIKYFKPSGLFKLLFAFLIFVGAETVFGVFIPVGYLGVALAAILVALRFYHPTVLTQNLALIIAIAGISANLGLLFPLSAVLVILAILSVYDVIAVYQTKHMLTLFKGLLDSGTPFAIIVPDKNISVHESIANAKPGTGKFLMLGTGDLAFPIIFAVSALPMGIAHSLAILAGSLVGMLSVHIILTQKKTGAIPALPPIIFASLIAFIISLYLF